MPRSARPSLRGRALLCLEPLEDRLLLAATAWQATPAATGLTTAAASPLPRDSQTVEGQPGAAPATPADSDESEYATTSPPTQQTQNASPPPAPSASARTNQTQAAYDYSTPGQAQPAQVYADTNQNLVAALRRQEAALVLVSGSQEKVTPPPVAVAIVPPPGFVVGAPVSQPVPSPKEVVGSILAVPGGRVPPDELLPAPMTGDSVRPSSDNLERSAESALATQQSEGSSHPLVFDLPGIVGAGGWEQAARRFLGALESLGAGESEQGSMWIRLGLWSLTAAGSAVLYELARQQLRNPRTEDSDLDPAGHSYGPRLC